MGSGETFGDTFRNKLLKVVITLAHETASCSHLIPTDLLVPSSAIQEPHVKDRKWVE